MTQRLAVTTGAVTTRAATAHGEMAVAMAVAAATEMAEVGRRRDDRALVTMIAAMTDVPAGSMFVRVSATLVRRAPTSHEVVRGHAELRRGVAERTRGRPGQPTARGPLKVVRDQVAPARARSATHIRRRAPRIDRAIVALLVRRHRDNAPAQSTTLGVDVLAS